MVTISYNGTWLESDDSTKLHLKYTNNLIERGHPELLHTVELSVPYTPKNANAVNYDHEIEFGGERYMVGGIVSDDGVVYRGQIGAMSTDGHRISLMFIYGKLTELFSRNIGELAAARDWNMPVFTGKGEELPNTTYSVGFVNYLNGAHAPGSVIGSHNPLVLPCCNLGYLITECAATYGWSVRVNGQDPMSMLVDDPYNPYFYMLKLATANVRTFDEVRVSRHRPNDPNWHLSVHATRGGYPISLQDAGFDFGEVKYRMGPFGIRYKVYAMIATRNMKLELPPRGGTETVPVAADGSLIAPWVLEGNTRPDDGNREYDLAPSVPLGFLRKNTWDYDRSRWKLSTRTTDSAVSDYTFNVVRDQFAASEGEQVDIAANLPDMTLADVLAAFCDIIMGTYEVNASANIINITSYDYARIGGNVIDLTGRDIVSHSKTTRYLDGYSQRNTINAKNGDFERQLVQDTDLVDGERNTATIPFDTGIIATTGDHTAYFADDVTIDTNNQVTYGGNCGIMCIDPDGGEPKHLSYVDDVLGVSAGFQSFVQSSDQITLSVRMSLLEFSDINAGTTMLHRGRKFLVRSATWSDGICEMELCTIP